MRIEPFSCVHPAPEHIGAYLGQGFGGDEGIRAGIKDKTLALDISRAFYLCAYCDGEHTWKMLVACMESEGDEACGAGVPSAAASRAGASPAQGSYQTEPQCVVYPSNIAIDIILGAATAAVPLYNVQNGAQQLVVWRISRAEALEALQAAFEGIQLSELTLPHKITMVGLVSEQGASMPALPAGLFAHKF